MIGSANVSDRSTNVRDYFNQRVTLATLVQNVKGETRGIRKVANDRYWSRTTVIDVLFLFLFGRHLGIILFPFPLTQAQ
jgi:hypothetical protein